MKIKTISLLLIIFLIFSACEKTELGKELDCTIGSTYKVTHDLSFSIDSVNDSRCPPNALCFWAGEVYLYLDINHNNSRIDTTMYLLNTSKNPIQIGDYSFKVLGVNPLVGGGLSTSKDIIIKMIITKN
jgi:hypothetical protein